MTAAERTHGGLTAGSLPWILSPWSCFPNETKGSILWPGAFFHSRNEKSFFRTIYYRVVNTATRTHSRTHSYTHTPLVVDSSFFWQTDKYEWKVKEVSGAPPAAREYSYSDQGGITTYWCTIIIEKSILLIDCVKYIHNQITCIQKCFIFEYIIWRWWAHRWIPPKYIVICKENLKSFFSRCCVCVFHVFRLCVCVCVWKDNTT